MSLHASLHSGLHVCWLCVCKLCVFIAHGNGKAHEGLSPTPATATGPQVRITINHLVFHKVLGKGSFGKVGLMVPIFKSFPEFNMKWLLRNLLCLWCYTYMGNKTKKSILKLSTRYSHENGSKMSRNSLYLHVSSSLEPLEVALLRKRNVWRCLKWRWIVIQAKSEGETSSRGWFLSCYHVLVYSVFKVCPSLNHI